MKTTTYLIILGAITSVFRHYFIAWVFGAMFILLIAVVVLKEVTRLKTKRQ